MLDQVGHHAFTAALAATPGAPGGWGPHPLALGYIPRTTPVGHATISTGHAPARHRIQGRAWFSHGSNAPHRVDTLPNTFPVTGTVFQDVFQLSLAHQLRTVAGDDAVIVAAAAKNFIPFLFGAWHTDVSVYPRTIAPVSDSTGYSLDVVFDAFTTRGHTAVLGLANQLTNLALGLVGAPWKIQWLAVQHAVLGPGHTRHAMRWTVPASWGTAQATVRSRWRRFLDVHIIAVDDFYSNVLEALLTAISPTRIHPEFALQSCVATDSFGHWYGPSSQQYQQALHAGIARALRLSQHSAVLVTSDHGGRDTPVWWTYAPETSMVTTPLANVTLRAGTPVLEGDHLVGYAGAPVLVMVEDVRGTAVQISPGLLAKSFHRAQMPHWILLPEQHAMIVDVARGNAGGGGVHGACEHLSQLSPIDGLVPLWALPKHMPPTTIPSGLDGVAATFLTLS